MRKVDPAKTKLVKELKHNSPLIGCRFDPAGRFVFAGAQDNTVQRWEIATGKRTAFEGHKSWVRALAFAGDTLFSADGWHLEGCPAVGPALAWGGGGGLYVWYTEAGTPGVYAAPWTPERGRTGVRRSLTDGLLDASHPRAAAFGAATLIAVEARPRADTASRVLAVRALDESGALTPWTLLGAEVENGWIATAGAAVALACWSERREGGPRVRVAQIEPRRPTRG